MDFSACHHFCLGTGVPRHSARGTHICKYVLRSMRRNVAELQVQATPSHTNSDVEQESDAACTMLEYSSSKELTACVGGGAGD